MIINYLTIAEPIDLYQLLEERIFLSGDVLDEQKEIFSNGWSIIVDDEFAKTIKTDDIAAFILDLVKIRSEEIRNIKPALKATLYFWFEEFPLQLCFNILSGENRKLPFHCKVNFADSPYPILNNFIKLVYHQSVYGNNLEAIEFIDKDDIRYGNEDEIDVSTITIDVWKITLPFE